MWKNGMISSQGDNHKKLGGPELTPLIDIVFIVIVFLLVTANTPLLTLPINVPSADEESQLGVATSESLAITINAVKPYWHIGSQTFDNWNEFKKSLLASTTESEVGLTIAVDKAAPTEPLLKLLSLLNQQKISAAKIIMKKSSE
jgi:biopolymer transport protein ExbD